MSCWQGKKYKLETTENFDEYMKELGVGMVLRKMGNTVSPTVEMKKEGDIFTLTTSSKFKTFSISFKLNEEFEEVTLDGRKVKTTCSLDGNTLMQEQKGDKPSIIVREFTDSKLITTFTAGDIKCVRVYKNT